MSNTSCVSISNDGNIKQANLSYYGKLEDINEINYYGQFCITLFEYKWADMTRDRGYKKDQWNFNCVNFDRLIHIEDREEHEPYIEASQAQMVYYVDYMVNEGWSIIVHIDQEIYIKWEKKWKKMYIKMSHMNNKSLNIFLASTMNICSWQKII